MDANKEKAGESSMNNPPALTGKHGQNLDPISIIFGHKGSQGDQRRVVDFAANFQSQYDFREDFSSVYVILRGKKSGFVFIRACPS
jgi:hypothetical protein